MRTTSKQTKAVSKRIKQRTKKTMLMTTPLFLRRTRMTVNGRKSKSIRNYCQHTITSVHQHTILKLQIKFRRDSVYLSIVRTHLALLTFLILQRYRKKSSQSFSRLAKLARLCTVSYQDLSLKTRLQLPQLNCWRTSRPSCLRTNFSRLAKKKSDSVGLSAKYTGILNKRCLLTQQQ